MGPTTSLSTEDDGALMGRVAAGDHAAFETLYYRYAPRIVSFARRLLNQPELIDEVINDTLLIVWQRAQDFDPSKCFSTWLFGIAHHKALHVLEHCTHHTRTSLLRITPETEEHEVPSEADTPEEALLHEDLQRMVQSALDSLSPEHRAVVDLTYYHGFSGAEIAEITACPVTTIKTRMFHSLKRLAEVLPADI
jgi:RNA polymerase sigma factor (sigma-70 family)